MQICDVAHSHMIGLPTYSYRELSGLPHRYDSGILVMIKLGFTIGIALACALVLAPSLNANIICLPAGTDHIQSAIPSLVDGDTLMLTTSGGRYHETDQVALPAVPLTIMAAPGLGAPPVWTSDGARHIRVYHDLHIKGIHLDGRDRVSYAIRSYAQTANRLVVEDCEIGRILKDGITDNDVPMDTCIVRNTVFHDIGGVAIEFRTDDMCRNLFVENCTFYALGEHAVHITEATVPITVRIANITLHNSNSGIFLNNITDAMITRSIITGCRTYAIRSDRPVALTDICTFQNRVDYDICHGGMGCFNDDPRYFDPDSGDFSLLPDSPCLNAVSHDSHLGDHRWTGAATVRASKLNLMYGGGRILVVMLLVAAVGAVFYRYVQQCARASERSDLEAQLQQAQRLETLGQLAGGIAHDFNNMLAVVIGYAQMSAEKVPAGSQAQQDIQRSLAAAERARDLSEQLLLFSRGSLLERKPIEIAPLIETLLGLVQVSIPRAVEVRRQIDPESGYVLADAAQIEQVVMNLCLNACDAMDGAGGVLTVTLSRDEVSPEFAEAHGMKKGPHVKLSIGDTGCGMPPEVKVHVFEPFFTTKPEGEGTGMGLAVVHGICKGHGGAIGVSSEPGKGTVFHVFLPSLNDAALLEAANSV